MNSSLVKMTAGYVFGNLHPKYLIFEKLPSKSVIIITNTLSLPWFLEYKGTQVPLDVIAIGQEKGGLGLHEWPVYSHEEVLESIKLLSLHHGLYCQDKDRVFYSNISFINKNTCNPIYPIPPFDSLIIQPSLNCRIKPLMMNWTLLNQMRIPPVYLRTPPLESFYTLIWMMQKGYLELYSTSTSEN